MSQRSYDYASTVSQIGSQWPGIAGIRNMIVFGASYCDVGYDFNTSPRPTIEEPLGVPFPGVTWAEPEKANWVGHLVNRLKDQTALLVYDFACGGDTTEGVEKQIKKQFIPGLVDDTADLQVGFDPELRTSGAIWAGSDTLFSLWVGINDCGYSGPGGIPPKVSKLFGLLELLYSKGARNFLLIDLPPIHRSPAVKYPKPTSEKYSFEEWNDLLRVQASQFPRAHEDVTFMIYSSWAAFTRILDQPVKYGFNVGDEKRKGGSIWVDHIHPTSKVHDELAKGIVSLLGGVAATL